MTLKKETQTDYQRIEQAIHYIRENVLEQPTLNQVAQAAGLSASHCQRLFRCYSGVSPKRFLQHLTLEHAKNLLRQSTSVMETPLSIGLSGP